MTVADVADGAGVLRLTTDGTPENPLTVVDLGSASGPIEVTAAVDMLAHRHGVVVGIGEIPQAPEALISSMTTTVCDDNELADIEATVAGAPIASVTFARLLDLTASVGVADGLMAESLAYSVLLAGQEFGDWRAVVERRGFVNQPNPVLVERVGDALHVTLNRPQRHNAFSRDMRDALLEALLIAELDQTVAEVVLGGAGSSYCSGGDLDEFGTAQDTSVAHLVRLSESVGYAVHRLRNRVHPVLHGACIGAGIEIPAFAARVEVRESAWFQLPELRMGLIPGAGGTVSITRRIGRSRTAWLALTGRRIDVSTALAWGLVDGRAG